MCIRDSTATEFHGVATPESSRPSRPISGQDPETVAGVILRMIEKKKKEIHLTWSGKLLLAIDRISNTLGNQVILLVSRFNHRPDKPAHKLAGRR